ncbi:MAG: type II and III secretion system protein family protein [Desulfobacca sp.]|uniref:type II and III secretion system protein family protein n=1 Tax=Desulfobacca sp. TaxID=2067990 RepID=UPI00404AA634
MSTKGPRQTLWHKLAMEIDQFAGLARITILVAISVLSLTVSGLAAPNLLERLQDEELEQTIRLRVGRSKVMRTTFPIQRISVADPEVADIVLISDREVYINGNASGVTNISLWGKQRFASAKVVVEPDISILKEKLFKVLPREKIAVEAAGDTVVLSGEVSGPVAQETALALAVPFVEGKKEKVVNLLHVGGVQQVMVAVRVAEINRSVGKQIGINFIYSTLDGRHFGATLLDRLSVLSNLTRNTGSVTAPGILSNTIGDSNAIASSQQLSSTVNAIFGGVAGNIFWSAFFDLLKQQGLGRILAEPNLVTTSGQEASFLAGGEFPIPVPSGLGTTSIEYKKFGVGLIFTPTVLDHDKIALRINPEVSELDFTSQTTVVVEGFVVPALRVRRTSTQVEMKDGQTLAIAGLLSDQHRTVVNKYPVLGDLPVLGTLFRSKSFQKSETELVILVTPYLVKNQPPGPHRLPTDKYVEPTDREFYLLDRLEGRGRPQPRPPAVTPKTTMPSEFGHQIQ